MSKQANCKSLKKKKNKKGQYMYHQESMRLKFPIILETRTALKSLPY